MVGAGCSCGVEIKIAHQSLSKSLYLFPMHDVITNCEFNQQVLVSDVIISHVNVFGVLFNFQWNFPQIFIRQFRTSNDVLIIGCTRRYVTCTQFMGQA